MKSTGLKVLGVAVLSCVSGTFIQIATRGLNVEDVAAVVGASLVLLSLVLFAAGIVMAILDYAKRR